MINFLKRLFKKFSGEEVIKTATDGENTITISDNGKELTLRLNNVVYSRLKKRSLYTNSYWDYFAPLPSLYKNPKILMIGLGGGTIAYQFTRLYKNLNMDVVEISKPMAEISKYFLPKKLNGVRVMIEDGSRYVKRKKSCYDIVILDAYEGDHIPDAFLNEEFIADVCSVLDENGILAINYALNLNALVSLEHYLNKIRKFFKVYTINNPFTSGNMLILCSKYMNRDQILQRLSTRFKENRDNAAVLKGYKEMT